MNLQTRLQKLEKAYRPQGGAGVCLPMEGIPGGGAGAMAP
jgi:hypothetical protein